MKKGIAAAAIVLLLAGGVFWIAGRRSAPRHDGRLKVVATIFPYYDFARQVGGEHADVSLLLPPGVEPHSFEPKPSDVLRINEADVFVYSGKYMEPWAADVIAGLGKDEEAIDASAGITLAASTAIDPDEPAGAPDPHIWTDFGNDEKIVDALAEAFSRRDPANALSYKANARAYKEKLVALDAEFRVGLADCASKEIVYGGHYAFGYLARRYGLKYIAAQGVSPDSEPTASDLASLISQIRRDKVKYVFYEELTSPKIAQAIAGEGGAGLLLLNAGHNVSRDALDSGATFIGIMEADLVSLKTGLSCRSGK